MAFHHQHSHGRVFEGLEAKMEKREDNKMRFIHNKPGAKKDPIHVVGDDGKKHKVHVNGGLVHVHDFGASQKNEVDIAADGKKHTFQSRPDLGLVHDFGVAKKKPVDVLREGKPHRVIANGGLIHVHDLDLAQKNAEVKTVYSQVTVTASKPFAGPAQYVTPTGDTNASLNSAEAAYASAKSAANAPDVADASSSAPATTTSTNSYQTTPPQFTRSGANQLKGSPHTTSRTGPSVVGGTPLSQSSTGGADLTKSKGNDGTSAGTSAGIAFGVILGLALVGGLLFFCWRRRKQQKAGEGAEKLDEKHTSTTSFFSGTAAAVGAPAGELRRDNSLHAHTAATAPRLSLRPVTQFLPNIMGGGNSNAESSRGAPQMSEKSKSGWDRTPAGASPNPFDDAAVLDEKNARPVSPMNPFEEGDGLAGSQPATPKAAQFGTANAVSIAAAGAPRQAPAAGPNNVHRVQLDFKPSMDDELELKSGQLVRMLHEYDDGWCLCIRMDRSQQGVCPRTCLSKLPVKPRPQGPPPNGPAGRPRGPPPPGMARPQSPAMRDNMIPRPLTPTGRERSNTGPRNAPQPLGGRPRSQSVGGAAERPMSPAGVPSRKPVPGQAL